MPYDRHMEFVSNVPDYHPQTGESKTKTVIDAYFHPDHIVLWGWGTLENLEVVEPEVLAEKMQEVGFACIWEDHKPY